MELLDHPAGGFRETFGKHSKDLSGTFLLEIEEASVQTASDLAVENLLLEFEGGLPDGKLAAAAQRLFTNEDRMRLRKRPTHWKVAWNFAQRMFLPWVLMSTTLTMALLTTDMSLPTESAALQFSALDILAMLAFAIGAWLDHRSTMDGFRRVDTMERNPLFPRYGFNRAVQVLGAAFMVYIALSMSWPFLFVAALLKCLVAILNGQYVEARLKLTREELANLRGVGHSAPGAAGIPAEVTRPAVAPARRARPIRFD